MAKKITQKEVIQTDLWQNTIDSTKALIKLVDDLNASLQTTTKISLKVVEGNKKTDFENLKGVSEEVDKINRSFDQKIKIDKERIKLEQRLAIARDERSKDNSKLKTQILEQNKLNRDNAKETLGLVSAYGKLAKQTNDAQKRFKDLAAQYGENSKEAERAEKSFLKLDTRLRGINERAKDGRRDVGRYGKALDGIGATLKKGLGFLGLATIISRVGRAFLNSFNRIREFDKELQNLAGISGKTREELGGIESEIISVAGASIRTSNEVAKLATVLFSLGKTEREVKLLLKPVNDLSIALNATSEETADFLGQTLNAFGKGAESGQEFADIIANVRTSTSLDFQRIKDALGFVAPTANALNLTLGETSALIGVLQDNGIKAARSGRLLNSSFARLVKQGKSLDGALEEINNSQNKVLTSTRLFGTESFALGIILADNIDKTAELANEFDNFSDGSLEKLTGEQLKSLDAQLNILDSSWEKFILNIENGTGSIGRFIISVLKGASSLLNLFTTEKKLTEETIALEKITKKYNVALKEEGERTRFLFGELKNELNSKSVKLQITQDINREYGDYLPSLLTEGSSLSDINDAQKLVNDSLRENVGLKILNREINQDQENFLQRQEVLFERVANSTGKSSEELTVFLSKYRRELGEASDLAEDADLRLLSEDELSEREKGINEFLESISNFTLDTFLSLENGSVSVRDAISELLNPNFGASTLRVRLKDILNTLSLTEKKVEDQISTNKTLNGLIEKQTKIVSDLNKEIAEARNEDDILNLKSRVDVATEELNRLKRIVSSTFEEIDRIERGLISDSTERRIAQEIDKSEKLIKQIESNSQIEESKKTELIKKENERLSKFVNDQEIEAGKERIKNAADLSKAEFEQRRTGFKTEEQFEKEKAKQFEAIQRKALEEELKLLEQFGDERTEVREEQIKAQLEGLDSLGEETIKNRVDTLSVLQALNDKFFDDKINKADEEIEATKSRESDLQSLANEGDADAAASLAQNQKDQAEAVRKKEELLQKEKKFELALAVISAFNAELDSGKSTPEALASAISSTSVLTSFVNSLPAFIDGTENVGESLGAPQLNGQDGHIIRVDGKERIVDPLNNAKMGGISNDLAANVISDFNNDLLTYNTPQLPIEVKRFDSGKKIIQKLDSLEKSLVGAINDKETYLGSDVDTIKNIINRHYKKGNTTIKLKSRGVRYD